MWWWYVLEQTVSALFLFRPTIFKLSFPVQLEMELEEGVPPLVCDCSHPSLESFFVAWYLLVDKRPGHYMHGRAAQFEVGKICMHVAAMTTPQRPGCPQLLLLLLRPQPVSQL